jgi:hypothetical protein
MKYVIYTITCKDLNILDSYVGRTSNDPILRFRNHISQALHNSDKLLYNTINQYGGIKNWEFNVIEQGETCDEFLHKERELYYVNKLKPTLNIYEPNRDIKKYRIDNRQQYNNYMKNYMKRRNLLKKQLQYFNML